MEPGRVSRSAMGSALLRAAHVREDEPPWILEDTLSASLLNARDVAELEQSMAAWTPRVRGAWRTAHAVRARLAEDTALEGLAAGRRDYVLLGAGLDTFAWRHPRAGEFRVREVDHPDTQSWKRRALRRRRMPEPENLRFVPVDLATTPVPRPDTDAGTSSNSSPATWNWLGVTVYLTRAATEATLLSVASHRPGTTLVTDFVLPPAHLDGLAAAVSASAASALADAHEPVLSCYTAAEAEAMLRASGFATVALLDADELSGRCLRSRPGLRLPGSTVIAVATV